MRINSGSIFLIFLGVLLVILAAMLLKIHDAKSGKIDSSTQLEIEAYVDASLRAKDIRNKIKGLPPGGTLEWLLLELKNAEEEMEKYEQKNR